MQFIDLQAKQARVFAHGKYILGPEVAELEEKLAIYVGVKGIRHRVG